MPVEAVSLSDVFGDTYLGLTLRIKRGSYVSAEQIGKAQAAARDEPTPPEIVAYAQRLARGEIRKKRGPRPRTGVGLLKRQIQETLLPDFVDHCYDWLKSCPKPRIDDALDGWACVEHPHWQQAAPRERSIRLGMEMFGRTYPPLQDFAFGWRHARRLCSDWEASR